LWKDWPITDLRADTYFPKRSPIYIYMVPKFQQYET